MNRNNDLKAILSSCLHNIKHQANLMKQCLDENNLLQGLKHCSNFLNELRTNQLSPKQYYELYIVVFDNLQTLSTHLLNSYKLQQEKLQKKPMSSSTPFLADLYELVQYLGNIIPRLYMMIVIGTTYMSVKGSPTKEIMKDLIEMCRGVQHPIRGLFLRYYLSQRTKELLPISDSTDFKQSVDFLVSNFIEMNKLWVRLQHQGHSSERELRYKERKELKILVGSNLVRLSQLIDDYQGDENYSSITYYQDNIFPIITEQIIQCRDHLAQTYLIDVLIQIFPDDFHFATLDPLLNNVFINLHPMLSKSDLISTLIERFMNYNKYQQELSVSSLSLQQNEEKGDKNGTQSHFDTTKLFDIFWNFYLKNFEIDPELPEEEHTKILQSIIKLSLTFDVNNYANLDKVFEFASQKLTKNNDTQAMRLQLLSVPINHFKSIKTLFKLSFFHEFYAKLTNEEYQKQISLEIVNKLLDQDELEYFTTVEEIDGIFQYLTVLIKHSDKHINTAKDLGVQKTIKVDDGYITQEFLDVQEKLCKIIHLVETPNDPFKNLSNLMYIRRKYLNKNFENIVYTYPTLISKILNKLRIVGYVNLKNKKRSTTVSNQDLLITTNFKNLSIIIDELYRYHQEHKSELVLQMYLNAAQVADQLQQESICYELFTQCFIVYEENLILGGKANYYHYVNPHDAVGGFSVPYQSVLTIANRLSTTRYFTKENYESLISKITLYGSKLLKKQEQCRAVYFCAHLWWWTELFLESDEKSPTVISEEQNETNDTTKKNKEAQETSDTETQQDDEKAKAGGDEDEEKDEEENLYRDPKRVLECLQKSLRVADSCMDPYLSLKLFIEILNRCLIFNIYGNYLIDHNYINGLIELIRTNVDNLQQSDDQLNSANDKESILFKISKRIFDRTLNYIKNQQELEQGFEGVIV